MGLLEYSQQHVLLGSCRVLRGRGGRFLLFLLRGWAFLLSGWLCHFSFLLLARVSSHLPGPGLTGDQVLLVFAVDYLGSINSQYIRFLFTVHRPDDRFSSRANVLLGPSEYRPLCASQLQSCRRAAASVDMAVRSTWLVSPA
jgi:hypothetical protein